MATDSPFFPHEVDNLVSNQHAGSLKCLHLNVRSLYNKETDIDDFINGFHFLFDAVMLSETWCRDGRDMPKFRHYQSFCVNRTNRRGGGVLLLLKERVSCELLPDFCVCCEDFEMVTVRANEYIFSVCYRPPNGNVLQFLSFYEQLLSFSAENSNYLVSAGDFNIDMLTTSVPQKTMLNILASNGYENLIRTPTRITSESETLLDLFITNADTENATAGVMSHDLSDHLPVFLFLRKHNFTKNRKHEYILCQSITQTRLDSFRDELLRCDLRQILEIDNVEIAYGKLIDEVCRIYKNHFPEKSSGSVKNYGSRG